MFASCLIRMVALNIRNIVSRWLVFKFASHRSHPSPSPHQLSTTTDACRQQQQHHQHHQQGHHVGRTAPLKAGKEAESKDEKVLGRYDWVFLFSGQVVERGGRGWEGLLGGTAGRAADRAQADVRGSD